MNEWFIPTGIAFIGFVIWLFSFLFGTRKVLIIGSIIGNVVIISGILLLWRRNFLSFAGILLCIQGFIVLFNFAFSIPNKKINKDGPLGNLIGKQGITVEDLNPRGNIKIEDKIFKASTEGLFVPKNFKVKIIRAGEKILIVEKEE